MSNSTLLNPFTLLGGLASDLVEITKVVGNEIVDIPSAIANGWEDGAVMHTQSSRSKVEKPVETAEKIMARLEKESKAKENEDLKLQMAEMQKQMDAILANQTKDTEEK